MKETLKKSGGAKPSRIADPRFASFETDPRFRLPSKKKTKTALDKRFSRMLTDDDFTAESKVDRYGRKLKSDSKKKALQRLYTDENEDEEKGEDRSDDEDEVEVEEDDLEVDDDEVIQRELLAAEEKYDPARGGGFSSSESDSDSDADDSDSDDDEEQGGAAVAVDGDMQKLQDEQANVEVGEVTKRIAIVNLDWDHVRSTDLMALFSSFLPTDGGRIEKISVFPSEFGKERMQQEEVEGPPKALFRSSANRDDEDSDDSGESDDEKIRDELLEEGNDEDFDSDALRAYQLDRLRYYYAVMECSSMAAAKKIYEATDGTEYQSSSNFLDLRFVPDEVDFDDQPRDECDRLPDSYKPIEFVTNALQSSKVKLTWDMHPEEASRKESIKRAFNGSRAEIEENDLRAYLASDSESEDEGVEVVDASADAKNATETAEEPKLSKQELRRKKMREALGLSEESSSKKSQSGPVGDMQVTFAPALSESKAAKEDLEETTIEKYMRKERERKEKKRLQNRAKREGDDGEGAEEPANELPRTEDGDDLGFNDPFFTTDGPEVASKTSIRKEERRKKREAKEAAEAQSAAERAHLSKVMAEDAQETGADHLDHFDMNEILRAEKLKRKKGRGKKGKFKQDRGGLQEDFTMDVGDKRFNAVFDSHEFAIDPSNPKYKATEGMQQLLDEGRKRRQVGGSEGDERRSKKMKKSKR